MRVSRSSVALTVLLFALGGPAGAQTAVPSDPGERCVRLVEEGKAGEALPFCRQALPGSADRSVRAAAARAEVEAGDPAAAVKILEALGAEGPLAAAETTLYARALLRIGRPEESEGVLRRLIAGGGGGEAWRTLLEERLSLGRASGAEKDIAEALKAFPEDCTLRELAAALYGSLGKDEAAAAEAREALRLGCDPFGWVRRPGMLERVGKPAYRPLLDTAAIVRGLPQQPDDEARFRVQLLESAMAPSATGALAEDLLQRKDYGIRLREIHLLLGQKERGLSALEAVLCQGDLFVRKMVLRQIAAAPDSSWIPLLENHLAREAAPGNRALAALALAEAYASAGRRAEAAALLQSIPEGDPVFPEARELLKRVEKGQP